MLAIMPPVIYVGPFLVIVTAAIVVLYKRQQRKVTPGFKAVVITGCDSGFGHLLAKRLIQEGYKVFAGCLDANGEGAKSLRSESWPKLEVLQLNVTSKEQIEAARISVVDMLMGHVLWAVVNNAGVANHAYFEWCSKDNFMKVMDINFMGVVNVTRAFLPFIRASKGRIINMSSMAGRTALPGFSAYSCSKSAVIAFSDSLRREMSHFGVKVITVEPSLYRTGLSALDTILARNESFWAEAEPGIKRDYGENYFRSTQGGWKRLLQFVSDDVSEVVDCYVLAVTAVCPNRRYVSPLYMRLLNDVMNVMICGVQDAVIHFVLGIGAKPDMLNRAAIENGRTGRRCSYAN